MQLVRYAVLLVACAAASGCVSPVARRYPAGNSAVSEATFKSLVRDLSSSKRQNAKAKDQLVALGKDSLPYLLREVDLRDCSYINERRQDRATRALRVIRNIGCTNAIEACEWLLLDADIDAKGISLNALFTEAVIYLHDNFRLQDARDIYVAFVTRHRDKYVEQELIKTHWRAGRRVDLLHVDITCNIPLLLRMDDKAAADAVAELVRLMKLPTYGGMAIHRLAPDGFTIMSDPLDSGGLEQLLLSTPAEK
jgi:hypothetical protein